MSVPVWKRKTNELSLFVDAQEFAIHILKITKNQKIFKIEFKTEITDKLNILAMDIYLNLWKANNIQLTKENHIRRKHYQSLALDNITDFFAIWNLAKRAFHLKHKKTEIVIQNLLKIEETAKKWIKNDVIRLNKLNDIENKTT